MAGETRPYHLTALDVVTLRIAIGARRCELQKLGAMVTTQESRNACSERLEALRAVEEKLK